MREHTFHDIDRVIDELHELFDRWVATPTTDDAHVPALLVLKLAVHEWIANLVQHAAFDQRPPLIRLRVSDGPKGLHCTIEDNSRGFDFQAQVATQARLLSRPEPSERGRGLLMMLACTEDLLYDAGHEGLHRLEFAVRLPVDVDALPTLFPASGEL